MTRAKNKSKAGVLKKWTLWVNLFFIFLLGLAYVTPFIRVETWGWLSLLALGYPILLLINGLFVLSWIFLGNWYAVFSLAMILLGFGHHIRYVKLFSFPNPASTCSASIEVLSYNMRGMSMVPVPKGSGADTRIEELYSALTDLKEIPDILSIQEGAKGELIAKRFGLDYTLHAPKSSLWLLSRYPILDHGELDGAEVSPSCLWADLKTPAGMLRVYNMHLVSNRVTNTTEELMEEMNLQEESTWSSIRFILSRYMKTTEKRAAEARLLRQHASGSPYPVLITGDGNDTPLSHTYYVLSKGLKDSFKERGFGLSTTYYSTLPLLRIDYFFGTRQIQFKDHRTLPLRYSDHYPVSTSICLGPGTGS